MPRPAPQTDCDLSELAAENYIFPTSKIIELRNKQLSYTQIAKIAGVSKQAIQQRMKPYAKAIDNIDAIKSQRAAMLTLVTNSWLEVYLSLSHEEKKKMVLRRGMVDYGILYDKMRLETGQSTSNVAYMDLIKARQQLQGELKAIDGE